MDSVYRAHEIYNKYKLTNDSIKIDGHILYRIRACKNFSDVKVGDLGGFVQTENNLSHGGDCWVGGNAMVYGDAWVYENAHIYEDAQICGSTYVAGNAQMYGNARSFGFVRIRGNAHIYGNSWIYCAQAIYINRTAKIDHGVWTQWITIGDNEYLLSPTLEMILAV